MMDWDRRLGGERDRPLFSRPGGRFADYKYRSHCVFSVQLLKSERLPIFKDAAM